SFLMAPDRAPVGACPHQILRVEQQLGHYRPIVSVLAGDEAGIDCHHLLLRSTRTRLLRWGCRGDRLRGRRFRRRESGRGTGSWSGHLGRVRLEGWRRDDLRGHARERVSGRDQNSLPFGVGAAVEGNGGSLDPGHSVRPHVRRASNTAALALTRLGVYEAIVTVHIGCGAHLEVAAYDFVIVLLPEGLLERGEEVAFGFRFGRLRPCPA